jgi:hypothetical protein
VVDALDKFLGELEGNGNEMFDIDKDISAMQSLTARMRGMLTCCERRTALTAWA